MTNNQRYVLDQINRIETQYKGNVEAQLDCMWRIASNQNLFGDRLRADGILLINQQAQVDKYIQQVKETGGANIQ